MSARQPPDPAGRTAGFDADTLMARTLGAAETLAASRPATPGEREVPTRIGRFTVVRELGSGAMGVVYAAYDEQLDRRVAIKLLHGESGQGETEGHARLLREAQALARLSHPNVVAVYEVGSFSGHVFLAMEYVQGQSVRAWLEATTAACACSTSAWPARPSRPRPRRASSTRRRSRATRCRRSSRWSARWSARRRTSPRSCTCACPPTRELRRAYLTARQRGDDGSARRAAMRLLLVLDGDHRLRPLWELWSLLAEVEVDRSGSRLDHLSLRLSRAEFYRHATEYPRALALVTGAIEECEADRECRESTMSTDLLACLGHVYTETGEGEHSLAVNRQALARRIEVYGPNHPAVARAYDALGGALELLGRYDESAAAQERALALRLAIHGRDHACVAESYNNLAGVLLQFDQVPRAAEFLRETARIEEAIFGPESPQIALTLMNLASALHKLGYHEEALRLLERAEKIQRTGLAPYHVQTMFTQALLAGVSQSLGRFEASERHFRAALKVIELRLDPDHLHGAMVKQNFAGLLRQLDRPREGLALVLPVLERMSASLEPSHPFLADLETSIAGLKDDLGEAAAAETPVRRALALQDAALAADDPRRLEALTELALLVRARDPHEALALVERALPMATSSTGTDALLADLHETQAIALVRTGGDPTRARASACLFDQARRRAGDTSAASRKRLHALKLLTPPCP